MALPAGTRKYLYFALSGTPDVLDALLKTIPSEDPIWDERPDLDRFTLREIVAHLADWEGVFLDRMVRTQTQSEPTLQSYDEGEWAIEHDYAHADPHDSLTRFRQGRAEMAAFVRALQDSEWERMGHHTQLGPMTLATQIVQIVAHDGYHTQQVALWLASGGR